VTCRPSEQENCEKLPFVVIQNTGYDGKFNKSCFWICIVDALRLMSQNGRFFNYPTAEQLRIESHFPEYSISFDTKEHAKYIRTINEKYKLNIAIYMVNYQGIDGSCWIGNPSMYFCAKKFLPPVYGQFSIAHFGGHYELIVSETNHSCNLLARTDAYFGAEIQYMKYRYDPDVDVQSTQVHQLLIILFDA
jgi:hypothetical protein